MMAYMKRIDIYFDIACFFNGRDRCYVEEILNTNSFFSKTGVDNLIEKSLVTVRDSNTFWIHGLVQNMGWKVILSTKQPGKRSRLWIAQDFIHVLKNKTVSGMNNNIFYITKFNLVISSTFLNSNMQCHAYESYVS